MKLLILYIDGFKYDYYREMDFVKDLTKSSMYGKLKPEFGFTSNLGAFFTGKKPEEHGYFAHLVFSKNSIFKWSKSVIPFFKFLEKIGLKKLSRFSLFSILNLVAVLKGRHYIIKLDGIDLDLLPYVDTGVKKHYYEESCFKVESLFNIIRKKNYRFHFYMWPFYGTNNKTYFELPLFNTDKYRFEKFKKIFKKEGDVYFVQFWDLDKKSHFSNEEELKKCIKGQDKIIEYFCKNFRENIVVWTDHGSTEVKNFINVKEVLNNLKVKPLKDYFYFLDSTLARFWFFNKKAENEILKVLKKTELIEIDGKIKKKYGLNFKDNRYGDAMFSVKPGTIIFPDFFNDTKKVKRMHGFFPETESEKGFYLIRSKKIKKGKKDLEIKDLFGIIKKIVK